MRRLAVLVLACLAACSSGVPDRDADTQMLLDDLHDNQPVLVELYTDDELVVIAESVCSSLDAGSDVDVVLDGFATYPHDIELAGLAGSAVGYLCPEHG